MKLLKAICIVCICALLVSCNSTPDNVSSASSNSKNSEISSSESESTVQTVIESSYLEHLYKKDIKSINCYYGTGAAVLNDGSAVFWGTNVYGGIGNGQ